MIICNMKYFGVAFPNLLKKQRRASRGLESLGFEETTLVCPVLVVGGIRDNLWWFTEWDTLVPEGNPEDT